jgi:capsular exopolysaccharide synthesis family protein
MTTITGGNTYKLEVRNDGLYIYKNASLEPLVFKQYTTVGEAHDLPFELAPLQLQTIKANIGTVYEVRINPVKTVADRLRSKFNVTAVGKNSELLELSMEGSLKSKSERILNGLMEVFKLDGIKLRQTISERTINFIQERFSVLANELDSIESSIKDYKVANNMLSVESKAALDYSKYNLSEEGLVAIEAQFLVLELIENTIELPLESLEILPNFIMEEDLSINSEIKAYNELVFQMDRLKADARANNPKFVVLRKELEDVKDNLKVSLQLLNTQLETKKRELEAKNNSYDLALKQIPSMELYMRNVERQQQIKETLYLFLLQKREEVAINKAITEPAMQVVEYASSWYDPIFPNPKNLFTMAILFGLAVPTGIIYLMFLLNTKIKSIEEIKSLTDGLPVLGEIPKLKDKDKFLLEKNDNSPIFEAYRILCSNLRFVLPVSKSKTGQVILCTSIIKGEGKTFNSVNLSIALASLGKRVLLIGGDLRNPQIHKLLETTKNDDGLSNYLYNEEVDWKLLLSSVKDFDNLEVMTSGPIPPNAPQLLDNGRLETLLEDAKLLYDYIIIDSAPTLLVSDTMLIANYADVTLFVVRYDYTEKELLNYVKDLHASKIKSIAFIFNGVKDSKSYGYKYGYNYGYGYGYGAKR